jgi:lipopolysaccharide transport system ATP-binding protein
MTAIEFENISKQYRLGLVSTKTLSHDLNRWWTVNVLGKEDPYLKIGETNDRATKGESDYVWALRDINFKVEQGDVLGIIGKNGAGKSTLLKILSRVTGPTTGHIRAKGRIASLLEVGTGFHPEMTGRENIFMNGSIMGMSKREIAAKLDEIVDFAGIERYIDTPVKRYSSGMTVRLGFSIAAHLEPEILVVDEVLAVGDAEFQKKAIGKMQDVSKGEGRTVLFVSHNMASLHNLCNNGILLENGKCVFSGTIDETIDQYLSTKVVSDATIESRFYGKEIPPAYITDVYFVDENENKIENVMSGSKMSVCVSYVSTLPHKTFVNMAVYNALSDKILHFGSEYVVEPQEDTPQKGMAIFSFERFPLPEGTYYLNFTLWSGNQRRDWLKDSVVLNVVMGDFYGTGRVPPVTDNKVFVDYTCSFKSI